MKGKLKFFWAYAPILLLVGGFVTLICAGTQSTNGILSGSGQMISAIALVMIILSVITTYVSMVIFIVTACKNPSFENGKKVFWGIMFYFFNMFAYPIYLHKYILTE